MHVMQLTPSLLDGVAELERLCFHQPWSADALGVLCREGGFGVAAVEDSRVLAYAGMLMVLDEGQITNVATHPDHRSKGYGATVLAALLAEARARGLAEITLEVRPSNAAALALYRRFGFAVVGRRTRFYSHPVEDALIMKCVLGETLC